MTNKGSNGNGGRIFTAAVPLQAGAVKRVQVYYDGINDKRTVLVCENGNWVFDIETNTIVPLLGKNSNVVVRNGKIIKI